MKKDVRTKVCTYNYYYYYNYKRKEYISKVTICVTRRKNGGEK